MAVGRKRNAKAEPKAGTPPKKVQEEKPAKAPRAKKEVPKKAEPTKPVRVAKSAKAEEPKKAEKPSKAVKPSSSKENQEPKAPRGRGVAKEAPEPRSKKAEASSSQEATRGVKRARVPREDVQAVKRAKVDDARLALRRPHLEAVAAQGGLVLSVGQGDTGQLGLGCDVMEASKPKVVTTLEGSPIVAVCAGGMHTLCLTRDGIVYSFGCNDDGALGRTTDDDDETYTPGKVDIPGRVVMISAGDSHSAAVTSEGRCFYWGTFRDNSGSFGLTPDGQTKPRPIPLAHNLTVKKIVSGENHIALLTDMGQIYTLGCAEQGRLGRISELFVSRGGRRGLGLLLVPETVHTKNRRVVFVDVWAGSMSTVALTTDNDVLVCGLNNYSQLGIQNKMEIFIMTPSISFTDIARDHGLAQVTFGQHHVMLLDARGKVFSLGRHDYGVLGQGEDLSGEVNFPTLLEGNLSNKACVEIACGSSVSYAVSTDGNAFSWGMGTNGQLSLSDDEDAYVPTKMLGKQFEGRKVVGVSSGGQHTVLLAQPVAVQSDAAE